MCSECLYGETSITKNVGGKDVVQTLQAGSCVCDDDWVGLSDSQCSGIQYCLLLLHLGGVRAMPEKDGLK